MTLRDVIELNPYQTSWIVGIAWLLLFSEALGRVWR